MKRSKSREYLEWHCWHLVPGSECRVGARDTLRDNAAHESVPVAGTMERAQLGSFAHVASLRRGAAAPCRTSRTITRGPVHNPNAQPAGEESQPLETQTLKEPARKAVTR